jgi:hypothetical protein
METADAEAERRQAELWREREDVLAEEHEAQVRLNALLRQREAMQRRDRQEAEEAARQLKEAQERQERQKARVGIWQRLGIRAK